MFKKLYWKLTLKLEIFTDLVTVPVGVYFSSVTGTIRTDSEIKTVVLGAACSGITCTIFGSIWRWIYLKEILRVLEQDSGSEYFNQVDKPKAKIKLLRYPINEANVIALRWFVGIPLAHAYCVLFNGGEFLPDLHSTIPYLMLLMIPIAFISFLYICEISIRPLFHIPKIRDIELSLKSIPQFSIFKRISISMFSLTLMPMVTLGYMMTEMANGTIKIDSPIMHIFLMAGLFSVPIIISAYLCTKSIQGGITEIGGVLTSLGMGHFNVKSMPASADEFGRQAFHLNNVIKNLNNLYNEINDLNANLEVKVTERTKELQESINRIELLKKQQDGDYFLTSLITNPLFKNYNNSKDVKTEFFVKQKKQFDFKKVSSELGGDICITGNLVFNGALYTFFINADAMGKSMQGAGGAIVLGTVMNSIISRSTVNDKSLNMNPVDWLSDTYYELHKVFLSFDGSMLVSCAVGLIEDRSGKMYYFNAEHPYTVLYRDKKASFIDKPANLRKLGTQLDFQFRIDEFLLEPGDILIAGSDGRDDIVLRESENDEGRIINEDETLFLRVVEKSECDLELIYRNLLGIGGLFDDLSLLKVVYIPGSR